MIQDEEEKTGGAVIMSKYKGRGSSDRKEASDGSMGGSPQIMWARRLGPGSSLGGLFGSFLLIAIFEMK